MSDGRRKKVTAVLILPELPAAPLDRAALTVADRDALATQMARGVRRALLAELEEEAILFNKGVQK
jgi:hypothetical protein